MKQLMVLVGLLLLIGGMACSSGLTEEEVRQISQEYAISGPKGDAGEPGPQGTQGEVGPKGDTGVAGPAGPRGDEGPSGEVGPKGETGETGETGTEGPQGTQGAIGSQGPQGATGPIGEKGERGPPYAVVDQAQLVEEVARAMVGISTESTSGSGFIFDSLGWVITNSSVVENVETVAVAFNDGTTERGTVIGRYRYVDLAVVRIEAERSFPALVWAKQDSVFDGDEVLALGLTSSDAGWLVTLSRGSIASKGSCPSDFYPQDPSVECIQTDAFNSGNAGGPLINLLGEVIGVNAKRPDSTEDAGYGLSSRWVREYMPDLMSSYFLDHDWIEIPAGKSLEVKFDARSRSNVRYRWRSDLGLDHGLLDVWQSNWDRSNCAGSMESENSFVSYSPSYILLLDNSLSSSLPAHVEIRYGVSPVGSGEVSSTISSRQLRNAPELSASSHCRQ